MALFGNKKPVRTTEVVQSSGENRKPGMPRSGRLASVLQHARITEKATDHTARGVYVFDVAERATKQDVKQAVRSLYAVTPRKIAIVNIPRKNIRNMRTGKSGVKGGGKKAYVYLKQGETITLS
ncbi:50S ribosomal protein L23 [Candidatus Kaiserbacteria bacterium]|nr:50S ribosomal protein L23 [Candidatus Kaiserbacteria bacterium]